MESAGYLRTFRNHWIVIVLVALVGLGLSSVVARTIQPSYEATSTLFLKVDSKGASLYERSQFSLQRVKSYGGLISSPDVLNAIASDLGLSDTPQQLARRISATNPANTVGIDVTAEAATADDAAALANSAARELSRAVDELENVTAAGGRDEDSTITLEQQGAAVPPLSPASPNIPVILGLGLLGGLALGLIAAIVLEALRPRVRSAADIRRIAGLPLIAQLPVRLGFTWSRGDAELPQSVKDALRTSAANLRALGRGTVPPIVLLVPVGRRPAASSTRVGLARGLAQTGRRVLLVEGDASTQRLERIGVAADAAGLGELLTGSSSLGELVTRVETGSFDALPTGTPGSIPSEFEVERRLPGAVAAILTDYDTAVVQVSAGSAPLDVSTIGTTARGAILVTSFTFSTARGLIRELAQLRVLGIVPLGVVMTDVPFWRRRRLADTWREEDFFTTVAAEPASATTGTASPVEAVTAPTVEEAENADGAVATVATPAPRAPRRNARSSRSRAKKPATRANASTAAGSSTGSADEESASEEDPGAAASAETEPTTTPESGDESASATLFDDGDESDGTESSDAAESSDVAESSDDPDRESESALR